jgi:hypothetical protein
VAKNLVPPSLKPTIVSTVNASAAILSVAGRCSAAILSAAGQFLSEAWTELRKPGWGEYRKVAPDPRYMHPVFLALEFDKRIATAWTKGRQSVTSPSIAIGDPPSAA